MSIATEVQRLQTAKADIKTAIEAKGVAVDEAAKIDTYASKVSEVYDAGYEKGKLEGGNGMNIANYAYIIKYKTDDWATSDIVVLDAPNLSTLQYFFEGNISKIKHFTINSSTPISNMGFVMRGDNECTVEIIVLNCDTSTCTTFSQAFFKCVNLTRVEGIPIDFSSATSIGKIFSYTYNVEYFRVVQNSIKVNADFGHCTRFDEDTIQSVINGLADLTGSNTQTLTLHKDIKAKLTDTQIAIITGKNWTIA